MNDFPSFSPLNSIHGLHKHRQHNFIHTDGKEAYTTTATNKKNDDDEDVAQQAVHQATHLCRGELRHGRGGRRLDGHGHNKLTLAFIEFSGAIFLVHGIR